MYIGGLQMLCDDDDDDVDPVALTLDFLTSKVVHVLHVTVTWVIFMSRADTVQIPVRNNKRQICDWTMSST